MFPYFVLTRAGMIAGFETREDARMFAMSASMVAKNRDQWFEVWRTGSTVVHNGTFVNGRVLAAT